MLCRKIVILCILLIPGAFPQHLLSSSKDYLSSLKLKNILASELAIRDDSDRLPSMAADLVEALMSSSFPTAVAEGISEKCKADSIEYVENFFRNRSTWALQSK